MDTPSVAPAAPAEPIEAAPVADAMDTDLAAEDAPVAPPAPAPAATAEAPAGAEANAAAPPPVDAPATPSDAPAPEPSGRPTRKRGRGGDADATGDPGRATQSARTGGLLTTASSRQAQKALEEESVFRRERLLDVYHAVESLCFYTAKEIAAQMQVVDGALTLRVPHGPTCMRVVVADLLRVLPKHVLALRATSEENARAWFPQPDTHWGLESSSQLPEYTRRALSLLETLCEVAASGKHRRLYQKIDADAVNATQDLALVSALELAAKKKIKRKIGAVADSPEAIADAARFLELAKTAAQTLKAVCTLYEWRDPYVAAAAAAWPPRKSRKPDGAPGSDTLLDAVVNGAFVALRRATPRPGVGIVKSVAEVAPARALLAGAARLAGVEGAAGVLARGGVDRLRPVLRLGLAAVRLAAAAPGDNAPALARAAAEAAHAEAARLGAAAVAAGEAVGEAAGDEAGEAGEAASPAATTAPAAAAAAADASDVPSKIPPITPATDEQRGAIEARDALLPVATHGLGLLQTLLDLETELPDGSSFSFLDAAAEDDLEDGCEPLLAAAVGAVLRACAEAMDAQTDAASEGWIGQQGKGWVLEKAGAGGAGGEGEKAAEEGGAGAAASNGNGGGGDAPPPAADAGATGEFTDLMADDVAPADAEKAAKEAAERAARSAAEAERSEKRAAALATATRRALEKSPPLPPPLGRGSGALVLAAMRSAEALSVDSSTQVATMEALAAPLGRVLALPERVFAQWWCGGAAAGFTHQDDDDVTTAAAAAAADTAGGAGRVAAAGSYRADLGCRVPAHAREELAAKGALRTAERALLLHHLLGNLHIHDARAAGEDEPRGRFLSLLVDAFGGSAGGEELPGGIAGTDEVGSGDASVLKRAFANLEALHAHVRAFPEGTVADHDVAIVQTLMDEFKCHLPGGGGAEAAAKAAAASAAAAAAAAPPVHADDAPIAAMLS